MNLHVRATSVFVLTAILTQVVCSFSLAMPNRAYPIGPNLQVTPGSLCSHPDARRYPEGIPYCNRDVDSLLKRDIIQTYDRQFGYSIETMNRQQFKIDHFIPLCAGGGNDSQNLWPQHVSVYTITDPLEPAICGKMSQGRLKQVDAVRLIKAAKLNLSIVQQTLDYVNRL